MRQRIITAIFFVAAMLGGIFGGALPFFLLFSFVAAGCLWELLGLMLDKDEPNFLVRRVLGLIIGLLPILNSGRSEKFISFHITQDFPLKYYIEIYWLWIILIYGTFLFELFQSSKRPFYNIAIVCFCYIYLTLPITLLFSIAQFPELYEPMSVFGILGLVWVSDTVAYFVGSKFGKHKLFEKISPKKTWEGTIGGVIGTLTVSWLASQYFTDFSKPEWLAIGVTIGIFAPLGDLVESMLKRSVGVKDSGNLLPGHGGLLDRFDAFIFVLPFVWVVLQIF